MALASSCFGSVVQESGDAAIWRTHAFNYFSSMPSLHTLKEVAKYQSLLELSLVNTYISAKQTKKDYEEGVRLMSALYTAQRHKVIQTMFPQTVLHFLTLMNEFESNYLEMNVEIE